MESQSLAQTNFDQTRTFRLVGSQDQIPLILDFLEAEGFESDALDFSPFCRILSKAPFQLGRSLAAFFGYIYIQDKSSMLPPLALNPPKGSPVLDLCASPGGKSIFLAQIVGFEGLVLANEPPGSRLGTLRANILRASLPQLASCVYDGQKIPLADNSWPYILLDAPCSGWGTAQKNPQAPKIWQGKKINPLLALQKRLLIKAAALLSPGGYLLYSTCTTNEAENEDQTLFAINELGLELIKLKPFANFQFQEILSGTLRVDGPASGSQGFYLALLRKNNMPENLSQQNISDLTFCRPEQNWQPKQVSNGGIPTNVNDFLKLPSNGRAAIFGSTVRYVSSLDSFPPGFIWQAYPLGKLMQNKFIPQARLHNFMLPKGAGVVPILQMDDPTEIHTLLSGSIKNTGLSGNVAALWWQDLPLGYVGLKNGRPVPAFK